jgi:hypothetical protein
VSLRDRPPLKFDCDRCARHPDLDEDGWLDPDGWNVRFGDGRVVAQVCPDCQTPAEVIEATVNEAMLEHHRDPKTHGFPGLTLGWLRCE